MKITILLAKRPTRLKVRLNIFLNVSTAQPKMQRTRAHRRHGPDLKAALCDALESKPQNNSKEEREFSSRTKADLVIIRPRQHRTIQPAAGDPWLQILAFAPLA